MTVASRRPVMSTRAVAPQAAPRIPPASTVQGKWQREYQAFLQQLPDLLATHRNRYVVIHEGQVVDSGTDDLALALQFFAKHGNLPVHVGLVTDQAQTALRVPHYRETPRTGEAT